MDKICKNCKYWDASKAYNAGMCRSLCLPLTEIAIVTLGDMSCPRWEAKEAEIPERLKGWVPVWHPASESPFVRKLVLMIYFGVPNPKVGYCENEVWYKNAGSRTVTPDYWTELP